MMRKVMMFSQEETKMRIQQNEGAEGDPGLKALVTDSLSAGA
jgi:hypothetical protein